MSHPTQVQSVLTVGIVQLTMSTHARKTQAIDSLQT